MSGELRIYSYSGCGTCRKALKWLKAQGIEGTVLAIRETPPTKQELRKALTFVSSLRALFNTSGGDYKSLSLKDRMATMSPEEAIALLSTHGNLVKRPFIVLPHGGVLIGFNEDAYAQAFSLPR